MHLFHVKSLRGPLEDLVNAGSLHMQREIYEAEIKPRLWTKWMQWILSRDMTMNFMGVPPSQKAHMTAPSVGGVSKYIERSLEEVLTALPFRENYFYRVYIEGRYPTDCRPEYVKENNFEMLKSRISDLHIHTGSVASFLEATHLRFSRYVLLDHMDWMSSYDTAELGREWNAILKRAASNARVIYRSAAQEVTYLDDLEVHLDSQRMLLRDVVRYNEALAKRLHPRDRVHTYASFYIADLPCR